MNRCLVSLFVFFPACGDVEAPHDQHDDHSNEIITTVELTFDDGDEVQVFTWSDPQNDGNPVFDPINLELDATYSVSVGFINSLEDPPEDITAEVADESDQHQVFFTGDGVDGPASDSTDPLIEHSYTDEDADGLPVGLENEIVAVSAGDGEVVVTLRHMPPEDDTPVKGETSAQDVAAGGFSAIGGDNDAQVTFPLSVAVP